MTSPGAFLYPTATSYPSAALYPGEASTPTTPTTPTPGGGTPIPTPEPTQTVWATPARELTVTFNTTVSPPRAELRITWAGATTVTITRTDPNNERFPVRLAEPATLDASGNWTGFDYELPYGVPATYTLSSAQKTATPSLTTGIFRVPFAWRSALIHPQAPSLSTPILLAPGTGAKVTRQARQAVLNVLGRARPVVVSDVRAAPSSQLVILCQTLEERRRLDAVLADGSPLRLACDPATGLGLEQSYIAVGDQDTDVPLRLLNPERLVTLPYFEVDRPAGKFRGGSGIDGGSGFWSYATAQAAYPTYRAAQAAFATYADAALDRVR